MSLVDAVTAELPALRAQAEALMTDTCAITSGPAETTFDPDTGTYTDTPGTTVYTGPCRVQVGNPSPRDVAVGEQEVIVERTVVSIPVDSPDVPPNSVVEITAVADISDPSLVGNRYRVVGTHAGTHKTARRLPCELVTS